MSARSRTCPAFCSLPVSKFAIPVGIPEQEPKAAIAHFRDQGIAAQDAAGGDAIVSLPQQMAQNVARIQTFSPPCPLLSSRIPAAGHLGPFALLKFHGRVAQIHRREIRPADDGHMEMVARCRGSFLGVLYNDRLDEFVPFPPLRTAMYFVVQSTSLKNLPVACRPNQSLHMIQVAFQCPSARARQPVFRLRQPPVKRFRAHDVIRCFQLSRVHAQVSVRGL